MCHLYVCGRVLLVQHRNQLALETLFHYSDGQYLKYISNVFMPITISYAGEAFKNGHSYSCQTVVCWRNLFFKFHGNIVFFKIAYPNSPKFCGRKNSAPSTTTNTNSLKKVSQHFCFSSAVNFRRMLRFLVFFCSA
jgi:hypothetical protein